MTEKRTIPSAKEAKDRKEFMQWCKICFKNEYNNQTYYAAAWNTFVTSAKIGLRSTEALSKYAREGTIGISVKIPKWYKNYTDAWDYLCASDFEEYAEWALNSDIIVSGVKRDTQTDWVNYFIEEAKIVCLDLTLEQAQMLVNTMRRK